MQPARNIEIKCRCEDLDAVRARALAAGAIDRGELHQTDTFFAAPDARLKLRVFADGTAELISYRRPDTADARASEYRRATVVDQIELAAVLAHALGVGGIVTKRRRLLIHGRTRIHLDEVEGRGRFVELETVLGAGSDADGHAELERVAIAIGIWDLARVSTPYVAL